MKEHEIEKAIQECIDRKARDPLTVEIEAICKALQGAWLRNPEQTLGRLVLALVKDRIEYDYHYDYCDVVKADNSFWIEALK